MLRRAAACLLLSLSGCGSDQDQAAAPFPLAVSQSAVVSYKRLVSLDYEDVLARARELATAIDAFVATPSPATHEAAKQAWLAARIPYGPSEAFRFYDGPIDNPETGPEGLLNGWPLDENYLDYTRDAPTAGIINDVVSAPTLTVELIEAANEAKGEKAISTGYHAIEFLLWGQDDQETGMGAGKRSYTDYLLVGGTNQNQERRGSYLKLTAQLLVKQLGDVAAQWRSDVPGNYAASFGVTPAMPGGDATKEAIADLLRSIGSLAQAELSGERMSVAYTSRDQEDEHSCFSDNTSADLLGTGLGLQNVWLGRYGSVDETGLVDVVTAADAALAAQTTAHIEAAVAKLTSLRDLQTTGKPFDVVIQSPDGSPERAAVLDAITALKAIGADIERAATALHLSVQLEQPSA